MSLRPAPGAFAVVAAPRRAVGCVKASRLDEVLATGVVYGTPVAYGLATQQDEHLTRSLKKASLGDVATGAPCVPLSFDPDYCKRLDKFYALGLAVASNIASIAAGKVAIYSYKALEAHIYQTFETECRGTWWHVLPDVYYQYLPGTAWTLEFCSDLTKAHDSRDGAVWRLAEAPPGAIWRLYKTGFGYMHTIPLPMKPFYILVDVVEAIVLAATRTGYALYTGNYSGLGNTDTDRTAAENMLVAAAIKLVASKIDEFARCIASYLRMNIRLWLRGGLGALKSSPYLNPLKFVQMVRYDILNDDDDDAAANAEVANPDPPPLESGSPSYREYVPPPNTPPGLRRFGSGADGIAE